jgi:hypothetical protein
LSACAASGRSTITGPDRATLDQLQEKLNDVPHVQRKLLLAGSGFATSFDTRAYAE